MTPQSTYAVAELFSGIGFVRAGLESASGLFRCVYTNDFDEEKCRCYRLNYAFPSCEPQDIRAVCPTQYCNVDLLTASFPCTDVSGAGLRSVGIDGNRTGIVFHVLDAIGKCDVKPRVLLFENVPGLLISNKGEDALKLLAEIARCGYHYLDMRQLDASHFVPQDRKRVFITACVTYSGPLLHPAAGNSETQPKALRSIQERFRHLNGQIKWMDFTVDALPEKVQDLDEHLDTSVPPSAWFDLARTLTLSNQFSDAHQEKLRSHASWPVAFVQSTYRGRVMARPNWQGRVPCLRRALGGGNVPKLLFRAESATQATQLKIRHLTKRELLKLQGMYSNYVLPENWSRTKVASAIGDAVCVPVIKWLAEQILLPLLEK